MGLFDTILGRTKPVRANLDALFALPTAALTLQSAGGLVTSGHAGVCWKPPPGQAAADAQKEIGELVGEGFRQAVDSFDYGWLLLDDPDLEELVTKIAVANSTLQDNGLGPSAAVLRSSASSRPRQRRATPRRSGSSISWSGAPSTLFSPRRNAYKERRDTELELRIRTMVGADLPVEPDLSRSVPHVGHARLLTNLSPGVRAAFRPTTPGGRLQMGKAEDRGGALRW